MLLAGLKGKTLLSSHLATGTQLATEFDKSIGKKTYCIFEVAK